MKTAIAITVVLMFATGVLKQNLVSFDSSRVSYTTCVVRAWRKSSITHEKAADAGARCKVESERKN